MSDNSEPSQPIRRGGPVVAVEDIDGVWNPPIRKGSSGWVIELVADGEVLVEFEGHRSQLVKTARVHPVAAAPPVDTRDRRRLRWRPARSKS